MDSTVAITRLESRYPGFPYDPDQNYPEFAGTRATDPSNAVYAAVRRILQTLALDEGQFGTPRWNPLGQLVRPGGTVAIKPNWVMDSNPAGDMDCLITHASVLRPLIDYAIAALRGEGRIIIGDAPIQMCDFRRLIDRSRIEDLLEGYRTTHPGVELRVEDWRLTVFDEERFLGHRAGSQRATGAPPEGYELINIKDDSFLGDIDDFSDRFRVTCYNPDLMKAHHAPGRHEYLITRRVLEADLVINVAKMKTHQKAGLTGALKNLVGINGHKEFLAHHMKGSFLEGGDNYVVPSVFKRLFENYDEKVWRLGNDGGALRRRMRFFVMGLLWRMWRLASGDRVIAGSWAGNETVWRTTLDINHILYYYDLDAAALSAEPVRRVLTVVDGVIAGEGDGPLAPDPFPAGVVIGGFNPASIDAVIARLIGFNLSRIPTVHNALYDIRSRFNTARNGALEVVEHDGARAVRKALGELESLGLRPHEYWHRALRAPVPSS